MVMLLAGARMVHPRGTSLVRRAERAGNRATIPASHGLGVGECVRRVIRQTGRDKLEAFAGNMAFRGFFAVFPSLLALLWLLNVLHATAMLDALLSIVATAMPRQAADAIRQELQSASSEHVSGARTLTALASIPVALWALSASMRATMQALNAMYAVEEERSLLKRYAVSLLLSLAVSAMLFASLLVVISTTRITTRIATVAGVGPIVQWTWVLAQWPVLLALVLGAFSLVYYFAPDVKQRFRWIRAGTVIAAALWVLFAGLYSLFTNRFADYSRFYGAVAGIIVLMIYIYASAYILLLGAEINQVIEMRDPDGKNEGEKAPRESRRQEVREPRVNV
jgi:membrane protein